MKKRFRMNYILRTASPVFWKEGPLLFDVAHVVPMFLRENQLSRLLHESNV